MVGSNRRGGKEVLVHEPISQGKAFLLSSIPSIPFGYYITRSLLDQINSSSNGCSRFEVVPCDEVSTLPEIVIGFKGQNVTLRGEDYVW
jgi:saccharopepsin